MKNLFDLYDCDNAEEVCGFILQSGEVVSVPNVHPEPTDGFEIDPRETLRYIEELAGIWHTHPNSTSVLSGEDKLYIEQWPQLAHYVIGQDGIREYAVKNGVVINANYIPR